MTTQRVSTAQSKKDYLLPEERKSTKHKTRVIESALLKKEVHQDGYRK